MPAKAAAQPDEREDRDPDAVGADAHHPRALLVVADEVDVGAEAVPVEQHPEDDRDPDHPHELGRDAVRSGR